MKLPRPAWLVSTVIFAVITPLIAQSQKTYNAEGTITVFSTPYEKINLMVDDDETEYLLDNATSLPKNTKREDLRVGQKIKITYLLSGKDYLIREVSVKSAKVDETLKFTGLFEFVEDDIAYVDGKKIKLLPDAAIECPGKKFLKRDCGCDKPKPYRGFDDKNIRKGSYFNVEGKQDKDGVINASKITVCRNTVTQDELALRQSVEANIGTNGLVKVKAPQDIMAANGLSQGNIKIGNVDYKLYDDVKVQGYVNMVGTRLIPEYAQDSFFLGDNQIIWRFYVIQNNIPNAFAFPNGMVFVHTGLLKIMENESQLALVLGHEISHVLYEHAAQRYSKSKYLEGGLANTAWERAKLFIPGMKQRIDTSNGIAASLTGFVDRLAPQNLSGLFEKTKEKQADRVGLFYMYIAGYDLREAPKFWLKMKTLTGDVSFQQKISSSAMNILQSKDLKLDKSLLNQLGEKGVNAVGGALLDNIYASHPLAQQRYDDISELIAIYYKNADFGKANAGVDEFRKYLGSIK